MDVKTLVDKLIEYNQQYRNGTPTISDEEYDRCIEQLRTMEPDHPFLHRVEVEMFNKNKVRHKEPMLSTEKAYTVDALTKWKKRIEKACKNNGIDVNDVVFRITPKLDGLAGNDKDSVLASRGDGELGFDITDCIDKGVYMPHDRNQGLGELVMVKSYFDTHLAHQFKHPRNVVVGVVGSDNVSAVFQKALQDKAIQFKPYKMLDNMLSSFNNLEEDVLLFKTTVLPAVDFPTDGIIIEVVNDYLKEYLGHTEHHYRWMIAVKDKGESAVTKVQSIQWQVGRTGVITPVLEIIPKQLAGATIHRVTAHNAGFVKKNYIGLGAEIEIIRSGEVIPKLVMVIKKANEVVLPSFCPSCSCELIWENDFLKCQNMLCGQQIDRRIEHWFKTLDTADWFGINTIAYITKQGVNSIEEFYNLTEDCFNKLNFGGIQSKNLYNALQQSMVTPIPEWKFIAALGILGLGKGNAKKLMRRYTIDDLLSLTEFDLNKLPNFGGKTSEHAIAGLQTLKPLIEHMRRRMNIYRENKNTDVSFISDRRIVCTGTMSVTREETEAFIVSLGGINQSSVNTKTDYLIVGEHPSLSKIKKAKTLNVEILTENQLKEKIHEIKH